MAKVWEISPFLYRRLQILPYCWLLPRFLAHMYIWSQVCCLVTRYDLLFLCLAPLSWCGGSHMCVDAGAWHVHSLSWHQFPLKLFDWTSFYLNLDLLDIATLDSATLQGIVILYIFVWRRNNLWQVWTGSASNTVTALRARRDCGRHKP